MISCASIVVSVAIYNVTALAHKDETARKEYGDYFHEIIKGRNTRDNSSLDDETERKDTSGQADSNPTTDDNNSVNVLLNQSLSPLML